MKKMIFKYQMVIVTLAMILILLLNISFQVNKTTSTLISAAEETFSQVEHILVENNASIAKIKTQLAQTSLLNAEMAARILSTTPELIDNVDALNKIAQLLEIDEIHLFDPKGEIVAGNHPEYWGISIHSGEQISFFAPLLTNKTLKLVQPVTPNTAEGKPMQYSALWNEDGSYIVQVGTAPVRLLEALEQNELSHIFNLLTTDAAVELYAVDPVSWELLGSTKHGHECYSLDDIGLTREQLSQTNQLFRAEVHGIDSYCIFSMVDNIMVGQVCASAPLHARLVRNVLIITSCLMVIALFLVLSSRWYLNRYIVRGITDINKKLDSITRGNLDERVAICTTPEFALLSRQINEMVESILSITDKISMVLDAVDIPVGVYTFSPGASRVYVTKHVPGILGLSDKEMETLVEDPALFQSHLDKLRANPAPDADNTFRLPNTSGRFVRQQSILRGKETMGILIDVSHEMLIRHQLKQERDIDVLTGLRNRRAFYEELEKLFAQPDRLGYGAMMLLDSDGLKLVNDTYGHQAGDQYLQETVNLIRESAPSNHLLARMGGDEFALFFHSCTSHQELIRQIEILRDARDSATTRLSNGASISLGFSMGFALIPNEGTNYHELLGIADARMYQEKRQRKSKSGQ